MSRSHASIQNTATVIQRLARRYTASGDMDLGNPKDTLIGVLLSARTKDAQVLKIFPAFKRRYPTFASLARSTPEAIRQQIATIGLNRGKSKAIHELSKIILREYSGKVPDTRDDLMRLPGIGRKGANCILSYVFAQDTICVDTHVFRIAHRLGWSKGKTPDKVEQDLQQMIPKRLWREINRTFVHFGRDVCQPRKPQCWRCPVADVCSYRHKTPEPRS
ncbi:endonuclease III [Candidatus Uhrbacteria bacterium]|nr:endonuclease III [Candidatus Uhrbacteria bacterium]MBD3284076.1 endonuclease III [Candidatus Uhrbacteria bacterium]